MNYLWSEKYRPTTLENYVFADNFQKETIEEWIKEGEIPHLLFSGSPGVGKTTLAKILFNELEIDDYDILEINASRENSVDTVRQKIINFSQTMPFGKFKCILLDESDGITPQGQNVLRGVMESYAASCRFILTCVTGDTLVYTPYGFKNIDSVKSSDYIISNNGVLKNKSLISKKSDDVWEITTEHHYKIKATSDHKFFTITGPAQLKDLSPGDDILIDLSNIHGNEFEYSITPDTFFDINDFKLFLKNKKYLTDEQLHFLKNNINLYFCNTHQKIYNYVIKNSLNIFNLVDVSKKLCLSRASVRNWLMKIKPYIISSSYASQSVYEYQLDLTKLKIDVAEFNNYSKILNLNYTHKNSILNKSKTIDNIISELKILDFKDEHILSMGRLIGFCEGGGHLSSYLHYSANNNITLEKIHLDILKFIQIDYDIRSNGKNSKGVCSYYKHITLQLLLEYFGATLGNKSKTVRHVSKFSSNKLFFKGYIQGLYDSNGRSICILKDDLSVQSIHLTQSAYNIKQLVYFEEIQHWLNHHFNIISTVSYKKVKYNSTFGGSDYYLNLISSKSENILKFLSCIGHYYDKLPRPDIIGYLKYKKTKTDYKFLKFSEWKDLYYGFGKLNDKIIKIVKINDETIVYDCSFDSHHWYITNGFISHNCNYPNRILPAIHSRTQGFHIERVDQLEFTKRIATILIEEEVEMNADTLDILDTYVKASYPDLRKCINLVQQNVKNGVLNPPKQNSNSADYKLKMVELFKTGQYTEARKLICSQCRQEEVEDLYRWAYDNLDIWGVTAEQQEMAILIIRKGLVNHSLVMDPEINIAATIIELSQIK